MPFDSLTGQQAAADSHKPENRIPRSHPLAIIVDIQAALLKDVLNPETEPRERAQCACAWEKLEDRKRILKGIGAPKPVDTQAKRRQGQSHSVGPVESMEEAPAKPPVASSD
jgi:hypothetical protein